jgi:phosphoribosylformimino-5-aminoimidazole carboxamide ribonucleotide (ProFAR) isomerase
MLDILGSSPKLVDSIYKKAEKIIHVVGDFEKGKLAVDAWRSSWRLDAVVSNKQRLWEIQERHTGDIVITDIGALSRTDGIRGGGL